MLRPLGVTRNVLSYHVISLVAWADAPCPFISFAMACRLVRKSQQMLVCFWYQISEYLIVLSLFFFIRFEDYVLLRRPSYVVILSGYYVVDGFVCH